MTPTIEIYDTTLRDGIQQESISLTARDKLQIAKLLDGLGVHYIEGGWPGANPKEDEFFQRAKTELNLKNATLVAFGSTRHAHTRADDDAVLNALLEAETEVICLVGKTWSYHVEHALRVDEKEAIAMVADSVDYLRSKGRRVFFDAEHFFDGYRDNADFALAVLKEAHLAGAERLVLCDTNGGWLAHDVERVVSDVGERLDGAVLGAHFHNDSGMAVANSLMAVRAGAIQVQGCVNGYGERTGNADLCSIIPNLQLKMGIKVVSDGQLAKLTSISHHLAEIINITLDPQLPYVGASAFTHKAGLHTSAIARRPDAYEHLPPSEVGNTTRVVVSEMAGRSTVLAKGKEWGIDLSDAEAQTVVVRVKELEHRGYQFEAADGSFELLIRDVRGWVQPFFELESYRVFVSSGSEIESEATVKLTVGGERRVVTREGDGPVSALDRALRAALVDTYPEINNIRLIDYRVRDLDSSDGTSARVRVLTTHKMGNDSWSTIGVHTNSINASWQAVVEGLVLGLLRSEHDVSSA